MTDKCEPWLRMQRIKLLTNLRVGIERLDMHDVADSSSDNDHFPTIGLAHTYDATQAPVSEICIAFEGDRSNRARPQLVYLSSPPGNSNCSFDMTLVKARMVNHSSSQCQ